MTFIFRYKRYVTINPKLYYVITLYYIIFIILIISFIDELFDSYNNASIITKYLYY